MKKLNAFLSLITVFLLLVHAGYSAYAYLTMYYNPSISKTLSCAVMTAVMIHAVISMISVFLNSDGTRLDRYPKLNKATVAQRVSAALILPLVFIHVNTFDLMKSASESGKTIVIYLLMATQIILFATVAAHISVSLSRVLVILGLLKSPSVQKKMDKICIIAGAVLTAFAAFAIIRGELIMFMGSH